MVKANTFRDNIRVNVVIQNDDGKLNSELDMDVGHELCFNVAYINGKFYMDYSKDGVVNDGEELEKVEWWEVGKLISTLLTYGFGHKFIDTNIMESKTRYGMLMSKGNTTIRLFKMGDSVEADMECMKFIQNTISAYTKHMEQEGSTIERDK